MTRKEAILKAAIELFMEKGYNGTATSEIAERAGVAHGTVFHHFGKKENLLLELTEATIKEIYERTANFPTEGLSGLDALIKTLRMTLEFIDLRWNSIYVLMQETPILMSPNMIGGEVSAFFHKIADMRRALIERGIADGSIRNCNVDAAVYAIEFLLSGITHTRMKGLLEIPDNITEEALGLFRKSIEA